MDIELIRAGDADALLDDPAFQLQWQALCERCPWSTPYQSPALARTWYGSYRARFDPLLLIWRDERGILAGLLCLATAVENGRLLLAGAPQFEYQVWICAPESGAAFGSQALHAVRRAFPRARLSFRYLPPRSPLQWARNSALRHYLLVRVCPRPLVRFDAADSSLAKANNKKRLKALARLGPIEFRRHCDPAEMNAILDELIVFYDRRQLEMYGRAPFASDPLKKAFHQALCRQPGLLHVTVLKVGARIASAQLNLCGGKGVQLNLTAYNPGYSSHSPGKFHIHMLTQMLASEGYEYLDLTPGGDPYKERFANDWEAAYALTLYPNLLARLAGVLHAHLEQAARRLMRRLGLHPARVNNLIRTLSGRGSRHAPGVVRQADQI